MDGITDRELPIKTASSLESAVAKIYQLLHISIIRIVPIILTLKLRVTAHGHAQDFLIDLEIA